MSYIVVWEHNQGKLFNVVTRKAWPGNAAVVVSTVAITKGHYSGEVLLDNEIVDEVSSYFVVGDFNDEPKRLPNTPYYSLGSYIYYLI